MNNEDLFTEDELKGIVESIGETLETWFEMTDEQVLALESVRDKIFLKYPEIAEYFRSQREENEETQELNMN